MYRHTTTYRVTVIKVGFNFVISISHYYILFKVSQILQQSQHKIKTSNLEVLFNYQQES